MIVWYPPSGLHLAVRLVWLIGTVLVGRRFTVNADTLGGGSRRHCGRGDGHRRRSSNRRMSHLECRLAVRKRRFSTTRRRLALLLCSSRVLTHVAETGVDPVRTPKRCSLTWASTHTIDRANVRGAKTEGATDGNQIRHARQKAKHARGEKKNKLLEVKLDSKCEL